MKRILLIIAVSLALVPCLKSTAFGGPLSAIGPVVSRDHGLHVDLWTDRSQDAVYNSGEPVEVYFRANDDCYVTIYGINTDGDVELLFPQYPDDGFVFGGMTYRLPEYYDDWGYRIGGPDGVGYLHAVATRTPRAFRYRPIGSRYHFGIDPVAGDPFLAINAINGRIILGSHIHATATVSYFVGRRVWYPRYACYDCHGRSPRFDPYLDECPRYTVRLARDYDYWWAYDYHPVSTRFVFGGAFWRFEVRTGPVHRHRHLRYVDCALGYHNYHPTRRIARPPHAAVYKSPVMTTRRTWQSSSERPTYSETRTRNVRGDGTRVRTTGSSRTLDRDGAASRSRSEVSPATPSSRSRSEVTPTAPSSRSRSFERSSEQPSISTPAPSGNPRSTTRSSSFSLPDRGSQSSRERGASSDDGRSGRSRSR